MSLPHGLYVSDFDETPRKIIGIHGDYCHVDYNEIGYEEMFLNDAEPIIRHPSDLTKPIVQSDYNNGEPFVPIVELARIAKPKLKTADGIFEVDKDHFEFGCRLWDNFFYYDKEGSFGYIIATQKQEYQILIKNQLQLLQQLIKWHFWPDMPEGEEVVYVTEEFNPYK